MVFFGASVLLGLAPGPDNLFVLTQSALHGRTAGIFVTLGLCTGLVAHTIAVALGVAALFQTSAIAFTILKVVGSCYLLYLAYQAFRSVVKGNQSSESDQTHSLMKLYLRGVVMNITNPKVSIFFLAFLPQFADPDRGALVAQLLILGLVFIAATIIVFGSISMLAGTLGDWLKGTTAQRLLNGLAGFVFAGLAIRLITVTR